MIYGQRAVFLKTKAEFNRIINAISCFIIYLPEIILTLFTLTISFVLCRIAGVHFYFCLSNIFFIMCKPIFFYCFPLVTLYIILSRSVRECKTHKEHNLFDLPLIVCREARSIFTDKNMIPMFFMFIFLLFLTGLFYVGISNIKPLVLLYNPKLWDAFLLRIDTLLLGGFDWTAWLCRFHHSLSSRIFNIFYLSLFPAFGTALMVLMYDKDTAAARRLILSLMIVALIGNLWHFLMPSLGDVYVNPARYMDIEKVYVRNIQEFLYLKQREIISSPGSFQTAPFIGIAAIPGLHIAKFLIYMFVIKGHSRLLLGIYSLTFIGLFFSTLYFGWHYMIDNIAGVVVAILVYFFVSRYV